MLRSLCAALLLLQAWNLPAHAVEPTVIVLSLDGLRYDYLERAETRAFSRMEGEGVRAERMVPVFPSSTFPNHASMATGTYPDRHGIVGNVFFDRERGWHRYSNDASWLQAEPLWVAAERQGVRSAVFFWVGSETDWQGIGASYRKAPFDSGISESRKVDQILEWLDLPQEERPRLVMSWWHGCDHVGHRKGPEHPGITDQLLDQDAQLGRLLRGLDERQAWESTTLLVVSDHGMIEVNNALGARASLRSTDIDFEWVSLVGGAHVFLKRPEQRALALRTLASLEGVRVFEKPAIPERLRARHPTRTGDLLLLTDPPNAFFEPTTTDQLMLGLGGLVGWKTGMHGFDPEVPEMATIFLALGRGAPPGKRLATVRSIDVAATVARLLGIEPPRHSEGTPLLP